MPGYGLGSKHRHEIDSIDGLEDRLGQIDDNVRDALMEAEEKAATMTYTVVIPVSWTESETVYIQDISVEGISSSMNPIVDIILSDEPETARIQMEAWANVSRIIANDGSIRVICLENKPEIEIQIQLKVVI